MRMHVITHVPYEGPGLIADWADERAIALTESEARTRVVPDVDAIDFLVVMGGPMAADDHEANPWLISEKRYLAEAVAAGVPTLGVCLGAQVLADALGGSVRRNVEHEIGWYPVRTTSSASRDPIVGALATEVVVGHWHGDTFTPPPGSEPLLESDACANQAFSAHDGRAIGLQFHLEWTRESLKALIAADGLDLANEGRYVSTPEALLAGLAMHGLACREMLWAILDRMTLLGEERV